MVEPSSDKKGKPWLTHGQEDEKVSPGAAFAIKAAQEAEAKNADDAKIAHEQDVQENVTKLGNEIRNTNDSAELPGLYLTLAGFLVEANEMDRAGAAYGMALVHANQHDRQDIIKDATEGLNAWSAYNNSVMSARIKAEHLPAMMGSAGNSPFCR